MIQASFMFEPPDILPRVLARHNAPLVTVDSHTQGEATRLLLRGQDSFPWSIPGQSMAEKRQQFMEHHDHVRQLLTREPRGHRDLLAAAVTAPATQGAHFGLIYMDARRYPFLCGHATIGAVTTLLELGLLEPNCVLPATESSLQVLVDTPSGVLETRAHAREGRVTDVAMTSMPSFVLEQNLPLDVPGLGRLTVDTVCVGGFFVMVNADAAGLDLGPDSRRQLIPLGMRIIEEANRQLEVRHPLRPEVKTIDVVEFYSEKGHGQGQGLVVYGESHMDRCPCGTGTTAKATLLHRRGQLPLEGRYCNAGPLETTFEAVIVEETTVGEIPAVRVQVAGSAVITGCHHFVLDAADPFVKGFLL